MDHDHSYKLLFSHREMMADLLQGFVTAEWVQAVDLSTLERVYSSHVSDDLRDREDDIIWRIRWQDGWLYIYLLVEFQSTVYRYMAVRLMTYEGLLYEGLIRSQQLMPRGLLPPVVPIVLYNGRDRWTAPQDIAALIATAPGGLAIPRPRRPYQVIDVGKLYRQCTGVPAEPGGRPVPPGEQSHARRRTAGTGEPGVLVA